MLRISIGLLTALAGITLVSLPATADDTEICAEAKVGDAGNAVLNACTRLIEQSTRSPEDRAQLHINRAAQYQLWNQDDQAIADYDSAIKLDPGNADPYFERGTLFWIAKKSHDRAIADFDEVIRLTPQDARGYMGRGTVFTLKDELNHALADYNVALSLDPMDVQLFGLRALVHERKGNLNAALADYRHASTMRPRDADEADAIKQSAVEIRRLELEIAALTPRAAPRITLPTLTLPSISTDMSDMTVCEKGQAAEAIMSCTRLIASGTVTGSALASAHAWRAGHLGSGADTDGAIDDYNKALQIDPGHVAAYMGRAATSEIKGDVARALADFRMAATLDPQMKQATDGVKRLEAAQAAKP
jgi:tetratricopeptide (TPR) repeat protein